MRCFASLLEEEKVPNTSSSFADEGTAAHQLGEWTLNDTGHRCEAYLGRIIEVKSDDGKVRKFTVDNEMCTNVQQYVDRVLDYAEGAELHVERKVRLFVPGFIVEEDGSFTSGTSDSIILQIRDRELQAHDLKYGRGVKVSAYKNEQLALYALMAVEEYELVEEFDSVRVVIHQPRLDWLDEWTCTREELAAFKENAITAGKRSIMIADGKIEATPGDYTPGDKQCRFCRGAATCPALAKKVFEGMIGEVDDMAAIEVLPRLADCTDRAVITVLPTDELAEKMKLVPLAEIWARAVAGEVERRVLSGTPVAGYKQVEGDLGDRKWSDADEAEKVLKSMRLKQEQMYDMKLISPPKAEKLLKKESPRRWKSLQELIIRAPGKPVVVLESDKRPELVVKPLTEEVDDLDAGEDLA